MRRPFRALGLAAVCCFASAHVGSPDSIFEGMAGPYRLRVIVRAPGVVPGLADISVRLLDAPRPRAITVLPLRGGIPTAALPPADTARPVSGDSSLYAAQLWLMAAGAYSVQVTASGPAGSGSALVPVMSVATRVLPMDRPLTWALGALGLFLFIGALEVVVAAARESTLAPGIEPDGARRLRAWMVTGVAAVLLGLGVWGGRLWWNAADASHAEGMYRPTRVSATVRHGPTGRALDLRLDSASWRNRGWTPLIPDHGKLMHLFLVRDAGFPGFAHLHPLLVDSGTFLSTLPPVPAGRYHLFADIVHESGFAETLVDSITLPAPQAVWRPSDTDDAYDARVAGAPTAKVDTLDDRSTMTWLAPTGEVTVGEPVELRFGVRGTDGRPATLQPYMGMAAHGAIARTDGGVFVHLHPMGTFTTATQLAIALRQPGDTIKGTLGARVTAAEREAMLGMGAGVAGDSGIVTLPYGFPRAGEYRVWVEVRRAGRVLTGAFTVNVHAAPGV